MNAQAQRPVVQYDWNNAIEAAQAKFDKSSLDFQQEQVFAVQLLMNNSYALKVAKENPTSLKLAMYNVAAVGLSLNPTLGLAYLVPRRVRRDEPSRICLDISYRGLIAIGVECGSIRWAKSELVYANDQFTYRGPAEKPEHICDPFSEDRGALRGAYCMAELPSGGYLVEAMSVKDMNKIRDKSEAFKNGVGPWVEWEEQMRLKCPVKRGAKWWPQAQSHPRLGTALQILNDENGEGIVFNHDQPAADLPAIPSLNELPPPPPAEQVNVSTRQMVQRLVDRAVPKGAWEACREVMGQRFQDRAELAFALDQLRIAKEAVSQQATH